MSEYDGKQFVGIDLHVRHESCSTRVGSLVGGSADAGGVVLGKCSMPVPTLACVVASWAAGCEAQGKSLSGSCAIRGSRARGSAGWVNIGEPSLMRRHDHPREMDAGPGYRAWPQRSGKRRPGSASRS